MSAVVRGLAAALGLGVLLAPAAATGASGAEPTGERPAVRVRSANGPSVHPAMTAHGSLIAFESTASNLVADDTNRREDIFLRYRRSDLTTRVSVSASGEEGNGASTDPTVDAHADSVGFTSAATNLVAGDTNRSLDVFVADRRTHDVVLVSQSTTGVRGNGDSWDPMLSRDGKHIVFTSAASNLVPGDTNGMSDVFVRNLESGVTNRASVSSRGLEGNGSSNQASITRHGNRIFFHSHSTNLTPPLSPLDSNSAMYLRHARSYTLEKIISGETDGENYWGAVNGRSSMSANGRYKFVPIQIWNVSYPSDWLHAIGHPGPVPIPEELEEENCYNLYAPSISADGNHVVAHTGGSGPWFCPGLPSIYSDMSAGTSQVVPASLEGAGMAGDTGHRVAISDSGDRVALASRDALVPRDTNGVADIYVWTPSTQHFELISR